MICCICIIADTLHYRDDDDDDDNNNNNMTVVGEIVKIIVLLFSYLVRTPTERMAKVNKIFPNV
jgi:hypothetical protein